MKRNIRILVTYFSKKVYKDNITAYAAQAALFIFMSLIPLLLVLLWLLRFTPVTPALIIKGLDLILPNSIADWFEPLIEDAYSSSLTALWIAILLALYSAAKCIHSLRNALNIAYEIRETRNWFKLRVRAMLETLLFIVVVVLSLWLVFFGTQIQDLIEANTPNVSLAIVTSRIIDCRLLIMFVFLILIFAYIYMVLPNRHATFKSQLPGAVLCTVTWYFFTFGLSFVIRYMNGFSFYGSMTTLVIILFWLYFGMLFFLFFGEFNYYFEGRVRAYRMNRAKRRTEEFRQQMEDEEAYQQMGDTAQQRLQDIREEKIQEEESDVPDPEDGSYEPSRKAEKLPMGQRVKVVLFEVLPIDDFGFFRKRTAAGNRKEDTEEENTIKDTIKDKVENTVETVKTVKDTVTEISKEKIKTENPK